jgi:hypothetical protein
MLQIEQLTKSLIELLLLLLLLLLSLFVNLIFLRASFNWLETSSSYYYYYFCHTLTNYFI